MANLITTILGRSGTGKSSSIRNLDPKITTIISTDGKILPVKGASKFTVKQVSGEDPNELFKILDELKNDPTQKIVVLDAFTQWGETLMFYCNHRYKGFDRQNAYNDAVFRLFERLKALNGKMVFLFAHPVIGETFESEDTVVAKIDNKQRKGIIEERSTILLMARIIKEGNTIKYVFETVPTVKTPTKAPIGMFNTDTIDNDLQIVVDKIKEYYA
jgi:hypothetical protein